MFDNGSICTLFLCYPAVVCCANHREDSSDAEEFWKTSPFGELLFLQSATSSVAVFIQFVLHYLSVTLPEKCVHEVGRILLIFFVTTLFSY